MFYRVCSGCKPSLAEGQLVFSDKGVSLIKTTGQTAQLTDQFSLTHQFYDCFVYEVSHHHWYIKQQLAKQLNWLTSFLWLISFMIALFMTQVAITGKTYIYYIVLLYIYIGCVVCKY